MKETRDMMGMPITVEIVDEKASLSDVQAVFDYFDFVDHKFSTYKDDSEISLINIGEISEENFSREMKEVFNLAEKTKQETDGYFDIKKPSGLLDPSGVVKGWAIRNAAEMLQRRGFKNFYIDAGGDIAHSGKNSEGKDWSIGIRNPFKRDEVVKIIYPAKLGEKSGVATSGNYIRGEHIYNPKNPSQKPKGLVSLTVVGPDVLEADRFATAAFAMGMQGLEFLEAMPGFEAYGINEDAVATMTSGFLDLLQK